MICTYESPLWLLRCALLFQLFNFLRLNNLPEVPVLRRKTRRKEIQCIGDASKSQPYFPQLLFSIAMYLMLAFQHGNEDLKNRHATKLHFIWAPPGMGEKSAGGDYGLHKICNYKLILRLKTPIVFLSASTIIFLYYYHVANIVF